MPENPVLLKVCNLVRHFGAVRAVDDISFELHRGESVGLIGANGAGKSTTMRMLMTLDSPDSGEILYNGIDALAYPEKVRGELGWMPDAFTPPAHTTVHDYLDFFARAYGLAGEKRVSEVARVMEFCGLPELSSRKVDALSKGQTQRLMLARTLVGDPQLLVLDEPAAGLDPKARLEFKRFVRDLQAQGKTLLISSHILTELAEMCDSMIFMDKGKIISQGTQAELAQRDGKGTLVTLRVVQDAAATLAADLQAHPELWSEVHVQPAGAVEALYIGEEGEAAAMELRRLSAAFLLTEFRRSERRLEETFVNMLNERHE